MSFENRNPRVLIVDYGLGNLYSVERALDYIGASVEITDNPDEVVKADRLVLPGVGTFGNGMEELRKRDLVEPIKEYVKSGKLLLGVCLGMHLLLTEGEEFGIHKGLDLIQGRVVRLKSSGSQEIFTYKIPHIGWNKLLFPRSINPQRISAVAQRRSPWHTTILEDLPEEVFVYFVHSNVAIPDDSLCCLAETVYGNNIFCSVIHKENIYGCQFHPERSGEIGLQIYRNFVRGANVEVKAVKKEEEDA